MTNQSIRRFGILALLFIIVSATSSNQLDKSEPTIYLTEVSDDPEYGMSPENAILVGTIGNEYTYMSQLRGPNGHKVKYKRLGSCCAFTCESCIMGMGLLDKWQVKGKGFKKKKRGGARGLTREG